MHTHNVGKHYKILCYSPYNSHHKDQLLTSKTFLGVSC